MDNPCFSIVMPAFNAEPYIDAAIKSVLCQSFKNWELIVVDDFSQDDTVTIVNNFVQRDSRIKLLTNKFCKGAAGARNTAIQFASGNFLSFLDSDDLWGEHVLQAQYHAFVSGAHLLHSSIRLISSDNSPLGFIAVPDVVTKNMMLFGNFMPNLTVSFDLNFYGKVSIPHFVSRNDYALWLKLFSLKSSPSIAYSYSGTKYRISQGSLSKSPFLTNIIRFFKVSCYYRNTCLVVLCLPFYLIILYFKKFHLSFYNTFVVPAFSFLGRHLDI